ncbi:MAG: hypothetical protein E7280_03715 [Lachnospiraceae bacterium]|nr:hypothetical protein [Lachnospiraceae bacterium]
MYYRYEVYDKQGCVGGLFRGSAYPLNALFDLDKEDFTKLNMVLDNLFDNDWLISPKLPDGTQADFYFTDIGNEKIEPYLIDINKLMKKVGYRVMSKNIDKCNDDIVYSDENQIAIIRR